MTAWNPADATSGAWSFSGGDLIATVSTGGAWVTVRATDPVDAATADHYFEVDITSFAAYAMVGICSSGASLASDGFWYGPDGWGYFSTGQSYNNNTPVSYGSSFTTDRIGVHLKAGKLYFLLNGAYQNSGDPDAGTGYAFDGITGDVYPALSLYVTGDAATGAFTAGDLVDQPAGSTAWDGGASGSVTGELAGDVPLVAGEFVGLMEPTGELAGDLVSVAGEFVGGSGIVGEFGGDLPSIAGDFPGGQGFFAVFAGDLPSIGGDFVGVAASAGALAGELPLIAGEFIGGYSVAGTISGDVPLIAGSMVGTTVLGAVLAGNLPLIAGSFVGGMATVGAMAGDVPLIAGAFNDGPVGVITGELSLAVGDFPAWAGTAADGIWLYIATQPPAQVYATDAIRGRLSPWLPMHRARFEVSATQSQIGARNDAFGVSLSGIGSSLRARLAAQAPFGVRVDVMDGGEVSRSGIVADIGNTLDGAVNIDCESAGWTSPLPLRTNADLGTFRDVQPLPWRYGRAVSGRCVRLGPSGKLWLWADHASERITSVQVDGQDYGAWQWRNDVDAGGNPITVIATADEIEEGADIVAVGDGARDRINGDLITNPADVVADLCARAGRSIDRGDLVPFRAECLARSLEVSGTIDSGSLQGALVSLADSIHAVFARDLAGLMRLLPRTGATVTIPARDTPTARAERANIATRLRVRYALEDDRPRASLEVRALGVELVRGISSADVVLPWIKDPRSAVDVATRMLGDRARASYVVPAIAAQRTRVLSGHVVSISVPALGLSGEALVTSAKIDEAGSTPTMLLRVGSVPTISIAAQAAAYTPDQYTGASVATVGDQRQLTISGPDGRPLAGARCTLNGSLVRISDGAGRVQFPASAMPPGQHSILIEAVGMDAMTISVTVP